VSWRWRSGANLEGTLCQASQAVRQQPAGAVLVDSTHPKVVSEHNPCAIAYGVHPVIGKPPPQPEATGGSGRFLPTEGREFGRRHHFRIFPSGMVLLQQAPPPPPLLRIRRTQTELHHNRKARRPQRNCLKTANDRGDRQKLSMPPQVEEHETLAGCRGGQRESGLRLPLDPACRALVAHQEVMFGALAQPTCCATTRLIAPLTWPGVLLTVSGGCATQRLVYGPRTNCCDAMLIPLKDGECIA